MIRWLLLFCLLLTTPAYAGKKIELWYRPGGSVSQHADEARRWAKNKDYLIIRDMQVSAAGLAVVYAWKELKVKMCYGPSKFNSRPGIWLHQTKYRDGNKWGFRDEAFIRWGIRTPVNGYKKIHPKELGIPACPKGLKGDRKISPRPEVWRP